MKLINKLTSLFKKKQKLPAKLGELSCVVKSILNDLDTKNVNKWEYDNRGYYTTLKRTDRDYALCVTECRSHRHGEGYGTYWSVSLSTLSTIEFTDIEKKELGIACNKLFMEIQNERKSRLRKQDEEKLKKLFPHCYKK